MAIHFPAVVALGQAPELFINLVELCIKRLETRCCYLYRHRNYKADLTIWRMDEISLCANKDLVTGRSRKLYTVFALEHATSL